ncbi:MAG: porin, partial [Rhodovibrionaceae bacterium]
YFTPRFGGFQLGVSYTPNVDAVGGNRQTFGLNTDEDAGDLNHVIGAGVNFVESFNSLDIAVFAGGEWANREADGVTTISLVPTPFGSYFAAADDRYQSYQAGLNIGFSGFTVGGSVSYVDAGLDGDFSDSDQWFYDVGATYTTGPWTVGLTYSYSDLTLDGLDLIPFGEGTFESRRHMVELGASYALSPGVTIYGAGQYMKQINDYEVDAFIGPDTDADQDSDGWALSVGTKLSF